MRYKPRQRGPANYVWQETVITVTWLREEQAIQRLELLQSLSDLLKIKFWRKADRCSSSPPMPGKPPGCPSRSGTPHQGVPNVIRIDNVYNTSLY